MILFSLLRILAFLLSLLPYQHDKKLFRLVWIVFRSLRGKEIERVRKHLVESGIRPTPQINRIYESLFLNGLDSLRYLHGRASIEGRVHIINRHLVQNLLNEHKPVVIVSIHTGAFEMLHRALTKFNRPVSLVASHHHSAGVDRFLRTVRAQQNLRMVRPDEAPKLLKDLIRKKGLMAIMVDQSRSGKGNVVELLGNPTYMWMRLPLEASKEGATIVTFHASRRGSEHVLKFESVYTPDTHPQEIQRKLTLEFERWILENPEQWTWNYPRLWKIE